MNKSSTIRTIIAVCLVATVLRWSGGAAAEPAAGSPAPELETRNSELDTAPALERAENVMALFAKLLCSGVFVVGRAPEEFIENDLKPAWLPGMPDLEKIHFEVDRERQRVVARMDGVPERVAVYNGDQGCTLCPRGEEQVHFTPVAISRSPQSSPGLPHPGQTIAQTPEQEVWQPPATKTEEILWPMGDMIDAAQQPPEVDQAALAEALDYAFDDLRLAAPQRTRAIVVVYKGQIIAERYAPGFTQDTRHIGWSMGKSITAALVGILVGQGHFKVDDPAPIAAWHQEPDPRSVITIAHLMRMSSGLDFTMGNPANGLMFTNEDDHSRVYFGAINVFDYSISQPLEFPPNTVWRYRNCDPLTLGKIIRDMVEQQGENYLTFPQRALFDKIGARHFVLEPDPWGNFIMTGFDYGTARDWARFGLLHLWDGVWQ
ncbi:MAG: serine hydrolase, partial [Candidatus Hydrogenedentes bacterium]|nr:serine hydrolase [Candidatus Hydrogenedentota bacterium]